MAVSALKKRLYHCIEEEVVPVLDKNECLRKLDLINNDIKGRLKENLRYDSNFSDIFIFYVGKNTKAFFEMYF